MLYQLKMESWFSAQRIAIERNMLLLFFTNQYDVSRQFCLWQLINSPAGYSVKNIFSLLTE